MSIVNDMPVLSAAAAGDELPIERGTALYKIDYSTLAGNILSSAPNAASLYLTGTTWADLYTQLTALSVNRSAAYKCNAAITSILTGAKFEAITFGVVSRLTDTIFEFMARQANAGVILAWRVTFSSATSASVGTVYQFTGTAI